MTTKHTLDGNWTEVATNPALLECVEGSVRIHFAGAAPIADEDAFHTLGDDSGRSLSYGGSLNSYARAHGAAAELIVTENV